MKIIAIISQNRRDFSAVLQCENCKQKENLTSGYDDRNYHDNVIPNFKCSNCGKSRNDLGVMQKPTATKYADYEVV